jgi:hypothetical protein
VSINVTACFGAAPRWEDYGIPCPAIGSFGYEIDAGLLRTPMESGHARQRRRYTSRPTSYELTWLLTTPQLHHFEALLDKAFTWLYVPLVTGQVPKWMAADHLIRFINNPQVQLEGKDLWRVSVVAEQYQIDLGCMLKEMCNDIGPCLTSATFYTFPAPDWAGIATGWGDSTFWGVANA